MDRELLIEIGTEEMPASWLPALTAQIGAALEARLKDARLSVGRAGRDLQHAAAPDRARRQDLASGRPTSRSSSPARRCRRRSTPTARPRRPARASPGSRASRSALERIEDRRRATYLGVRKQQRGKAAVDVLPDVLTGVLRDLTFPKQMRWDAMLEDGKGELPFGRPIRWILFLYGGRVVPFTIVRTPLARRARACRTYARAPSTYGHRFLATSGRAGRAIKVKGFDDYRKRLAENFVVLERSERHDRIARELDVEARRRGGRIARALVGQRLLEEVPDLVEYPVVRLGRASPRSSCSCPKKC